MLSVACLHAPAPSAITQPNPPLQRAKMEAGVRACVGARMRRSCFTNVYVCRGCRKASKNELQIRNIGMEAIKGSARVMRI